MEELKNGDILICKRNSGLIAKLIRWATKSEWSHVALYIELEGIGFIAEAQVKGVHLMALNQWEDKYDYSYKILRKNAPIDVTARALSKVGNTAYDFVSFIIRQPYRLITKNFKNKGKEEEERSMICSEYVAWVYNLDDWYKELPSTLNQHLSESPKWSEIK